MATSNVELRVDARQAVQALRQVNRASQLADTATQKLRQAVTGMANDVQRAATSIRNLATRALNQLRDSAQRAAASMRQMFAAANGGGFGGLTSSIGKLAAAYATLRTAQQLVQAGIQREESSRRLSFLARGYGEISEAQRAAARTGRQFGLSITESNQQFAQLYGRLRPLNVSLDDIEAAFVGFNTAAKVSGATTAETAGALLQLTQALGSGVLRGQELNSVLEQAPGLVVALTRELNAPISQIRKLAEEGKITSDVVIRALRRAGSEGADQLADAMKGPAQQVKNLQNAFQDLQVALSQYVLPAFVGVIQGATGLLNVFNELIGRIGAATQALFGFNEAQRLGAAARGGGGASMAAARTRLANIGQDISLLQRQQQGARGPERMRLGTQINRLRAQQRALREGIGAGEAAIGGGGAAPSSAAAVTAAAGGGKAGGGGRARAGDAERAAKAAADELARVNGIVRERKAETEVLMLREGMADRISAAEAAGDRALQIRLQGEQRALDIQYKYAQELARENDIRAQRAIIDQGIAELYINQNQTQRELAEFQRQADQDRLTALQKAIELQYEQNTAIQQQKQLADSVATTIGQGMTSAFDALINGAQSWEKSLQQIASGVLVDIANQLIRIYVIEQAINAIKAFLSPAGPAKLIPGAPAPPPAAPLPPLPARAMGGSVTGGKPYLVGEKGPELFMPGRSGGIAPTGTFGGGINVVVNVDASGTSVAGNEPDAAQLGRAVSVAVQAEIIKQQRPGGLLAATRR